MIAGGNKVELLRNGDEIFPAMLEAIRGAEANICFETYVYWTGKIAEEFADALCDRSKNGVGVHVLLDWYGSLRMSDELIDRMVDAGVEVGRFRPLKWFTPPPLQPPNAPQATHRRWENRIHRRCRHCPGVDGDAQDPDQWRSNQSAEVPLDLASAILRWQSTEPPPPGRILSICRIAMPPAENPRQRVDPHRP
jgi:cardiolipin synthase